MEQRLPRRRGIWILLQGIFDVLWFVTTMMHGTGLPLNGTGGGWDFLGNVHDQDEAAVKAVRDGTIGPLRLTLFRFRRIYVGRNIGGQRWMVAQWKAAGIRDSGEGTTLASLVTARSTLAYRLMVLLRSIIDGHKRADDPFARGVAELERDHARRKRSAIPTRPQSRRAVDTCARNAGGLSAIDGARLWGPPANVCGQDEITRPVAAHLLTAGILRPKAGRATPELLLRSCSPKPSAERARRAGAAWDVDQVPGAGRVDVERVTTRRCSWMRARARACAPTGAAGAAASALRAHTPHVWRE